MKEGRVERKYDENGNPLPLINPVLRDPPKESEKTTILPARVFTIQDMREAFQLGAAYARRNPFMPPEINAIKWAEEAARRWPK